MADKDFFRNGNTDSQAKKTLQELLEGEGHYAGRMLNDVDIETQRDGSFCVLKILLIS